MSRPIAILTLSAEDAREMIREAVREALSAERQQAAAGAERLSMAAAARLAHTRPATVLAALQSGALLGTKRGRDWCTFANDVRAWCAAGRPLTP